MGIPFGQSQITINTFHLSDNRLRKAILTWRNKSFGHCWMVFSTRASKMPTEVSAFTMFCGNVPAFDLTSRSLKTVKDPPSKLGFTFLFLQGSFLRPCDFLENYIRNNSRQSPACTTSVSFQLEPYVFRFRWFLCEETFPLFLTDVAHQLRGFHFRHQLLKMHDLHVGRVSYFLLKQSRLVEWPGSYGGYCWNILRASSMVT